MDDRLRRLEREYAETENPLVGEALKALRKRSASYAAGDFVRLDALRVEDIPAHATGNWRVVTIVTTPEGRTITLTRLGSEAEVDYDTLRYEYAEENILSVTDYLLDRLAVPADEPIEVEGEPVPPCPTPLHYRIRAREQDAPHVAGLKVRERTRRTSAPDFALPFTSRNASGISITPRAVHLPLPEPVAVETEEADDEVPGEDD